MPLGYNHYRTMVKNGKRTLKDKAVDWLYNHLVIKAILHDALILLMSTLSALCFSFGFNIFVDGITVPASITGSTSETLVRFASGGVSGISQNVALLFNIIIPSWNFDHKTMISVLYFVINVPMMILAFFGIGKKFAIFTFINVLETSLFIKIFTGDNFPFFYELAWFVEQNGGMLARALFGGVFIGLSTAICFKADISTGGVDIISYYFALKKGDSAGKYSMVVNLVSVCLFSFLTLWNNYVNPPVVESINPFLTIIYSILYVFASTLVIDRIHVRNKKAKISVVTDKRDLAGILIQSLPHGATIVEGEGAYTGTKKYVISFVVSSFEISTAMKVIQNNDPTAFVEVVYLNQVMGRFHNKPVK